MAATLSVEEFARIAGWVQQHFGIKLPPSKKLMLEGRLRRRMKQTGFTSLAAYLAYAFSPEGQGGEFIRMVDEITTNKTEFFREPSHFEFLTRQALPRFLGKQTSLKIWSAACSSGEEPYTLAMVASEFAELNNGNFRFEILASDISTKVLRKAQEAIYREEQIAGIPAPLRKKYLLRSSDRKLGLVQIDHPLRRRVTFERINLMDEALDLRERFHIIFCRNVLIYFAKEDQAKVMCRLHRHLVPGGFLFIGHSESLAGMGTPLSLFAPTIYRRL